MSFDQLVTECQLPCSCQCVSRCYYLHSFSKVWFLGDNVFPNISVSTRSHVLVRCHSSFCQISFFKMTFVQRSQFAKLSQVLKDVRDFEKCVRFAKFARFHSFAKSHKFCKTSQFLLYVTVVIFSSFHQSKVTFSHIFNMLPLLHLAIEYQHILNTLLIMCVYILVLQTMAVQGKMYIYSTSNLPPSTNNFQTSPIPPTEMVPCQRI